VVIELAGCFQEHWRDEPRSLEAKGRSPRSSGNPSNQVKMRPKPVLELELRPVAAPTQANPGAYVYVLLPSLEELIGDPDFARGDPIRVQGGEGWSWSGRNPPWAGH
jgi:hypothetical protein